MTYDLRVEPWIPWRRRRSGIVWGPISMLVDGIGGDDSVIATAAPRADFDGAMTEFLIGILSAALKPADETEWRAKWDLPPSVNELQAALSALPDAFQLDSDDSPRFLQDMVPAELAECDILPIDRLCMDSPGAKGVELNSTLFVKPARFAQLSRPAAAMALITLQSYAPTGGQGHRTSMRGGGPLTTLAEPRMSTAACHADEQPLWELLWFNVETMEQARDRARSGGALTPALVFPWLAPTFVSDNKKPPVTPARAHALQAYFGMPRRVQLLFGTAGRCNLTGRGDERLVTGFQMRNYGVEYSGWKHPLSPHYQSKGLEWLSLHPQPGGLTWKDWPDLALQKPDGTREAAACVIQAKRRAETLGGVEIRLRAFGYDVDKWKARAWVNAVQPLLIVSLDAPEDSQWLAHLACALVESTRLATAALTYAIKTAWFQRVEDAGGDYAVPKQQLWARTEADFFATLRVARMAGLSRTSVQAGLQTFLPLLRAATMALLEEFASVDGAQIMAVRRRVGARHALSGTFAGYGKLGTELYRALDIEVPQATVHQKRISPRKRGTKPS